MCKVLMSLTAFTPMLAAAKPIESAVQNVSGFLGTVFPILIVLVVAIAVWSAMARGEDFFKPLLMISALPLVFVARSMLNVLEQPDVEPAAPKPTPDAPNPLDWTLWLLVVLVGAGIAASIYATVKHLDRRERLRQVKRDRAGLLDVLGQVDNLMQHRIDNTTSNMTQRDLDRFNNAQAMLTAIHDRLMPLLEFVQDGHPLTTGQQAILANDGRLFGECAQVLTPRRDVPAAALIRPVGLAPAPQAPAHNPDRREEQPCHHDSMLLTVAALAMLDQDSSAPEPLQYLDPDPTPSCSIDPAQNDLSCMGSDAQY